MANIWKWKVQAVVAITYGVLFVLYFVEKYGQLSRFPTIVSLHSKGLQLVCINAGPETFMLYDIFGHREEVDKSHLRTKDGWLMNLLSRELLQDKDVELRTDLNKHILYCQVLRDGRYFAYPYGASLELGPPGLETWKSMVNLDEKLAACPAEMEECGVEELKKMVCAYIGSPVRLKLVFTNSYVVAHAGKETKIFRLDVKGYLEPYDIRGYDEGEVMFNLYFVEFKVFIAPGRSLKRTDAIQAPFPVKDDSLLGRMSEEEYVPWKEGLLHMHYHEYADPEEYNRFDRSLNEYLRSGYYNSLLNLFYKASVARQNPAHESNNDLKS